MATIAICRSRAESALQPLGCRCPFKVLSHAFRYTPYALQLAASIMIRPYLYVGLSKLQNGRRTPSQRTLCSSIAPPWVGHPNHNDALQMQEAEAPVLLENPECLGSEVRILDCPVLGPDSVANLYYGDYTLDGRSCGTPLSSKVPTYIACGSATGPGETSGYVCRHKQSQPAHTCCNVATDHFHATVPFHAPT